MLIPFLYLSLIAPLKVAVIDTGLNLADSRFSGILCSEGHADFTGQGINDVNGHGTHVAGLIKQFAKNSNYCLIIIKYYVEGDRLSGEKAIAAMRYATSIKVNIINFSGGGSYSNGQEEDIIATNPKVKFIVAAGNDGKNMDTSDYCYYPACYVHTNVVPVGGLNEDGSRFIHSNFGSKVKAWERATNVYSTLPNGKFGVMSGTSQATAIFTGKLIKSYEKK